MMNVLIVGFGSIAKKHLNALNSMNEEFKIFALRSKKDASNEDGVCNVYNYDEINVNIDFIIISNPTNLHHNFIEYFIETKIPLFIEKPPVDVLERAMELSLRIKSSKIITYVACNLRFHPCIKYLKDFISSNPEKRINEVNIYCGSYLPEWRLKSDFRKNYSANAEMGGGVHLDLFHEMDYTHWIFGKPQYSNCVRKNISSLHISSSDYANYILEYKDFTVSIILNYYRRDPKRCIEIVFEDETWTSDLILSRIVNNNSQVIYQTENFNIGNTYIQQMQYFIRCLKENRKPMNSFEESIKVLKISLK